MVNVKWNVFIQHFSANLGPLKAPYTSAFIRSHPGGDYEDRTQASKDNQLALLTWAWGGQACSRTLLHVDRN